MLQPRSLFARTYFTLAVTLLLFLVLSTFSVVYFILVPVSNRAANDFASLILLTSKTWVELPPQTRPDFEGELADTYELLISPAKGTLEAPTRFLPYVHILEATLLDRTGESIPVLVSMRGGEEWFSVDIPVAGQVLRFSFPHSRVGARPPVALFNVMLVGIILILVSSLYLVRRITNPITRLSEAIDKLGREGQVLALPESGPQEIRSLTRHFNKMSTDISTLLAARSTLFAGISHDLRTPLTRIQLALELMSKSADPALVSRVRHDLDEMAQLISDTLDLSRGLTSREHETVEIYDFVSTLVASLPAKQANVEFGSSGSHHCSIDTLAMRRVLTNLIENAQRYGGGSLVEVCCLNTDSTVIIQVMDRGEGIPPSQRKAVFQPFYRLENSRSRSTGGSGLGLAIVQHLCDSNGWSVRLLGREGGGTQIEIEFPCQ